MKRTNESGQGELFVAIFLGIIAVLIWCTLIDRIIHRNDPPTVEQQTETACERHCYPNRSRIVDSECWCNNEWLPRTKSAN